MQEKSSPFLIDKIFRSVVKYSHKEMQMPRIVPIRDLKNTTAISQICHEDKEPIFVTKNGYGDMVIMSMETYEKNLFLSNVYGKLEEAKQDMENGRYASVEDAVSRIREKHGL